MDNVLIAHKLVKNYHRKKGPPKCTLKIDLRKAFDLCAGILLRKFY